MAHYQEQIDTETKSKVVDDRLADFCDTERQLQVFEAVKLHGSMKKAANSLSTTYDNVKKIMRSIRRKAENSDNMSSIMPAEHDIEMGDPIAEGFHIDKVSNMMVNRFGKPIWIKSSADEITQRKSLKVAAEVFCADLPRIEPTEWQRDKYDTDVIPWFQIGDAHIGMLAHDAEVGHNFDLKIAERELSVALKIMVDRAPKTERCVIQDLGDATHYDNNFGKTSTSGHDLDYDTRHRKMIEVYTRTFRRIIGFLLEKYKYVDFIVNQGNHSEVNDGWMAVFLENVYENEPRLNVLDNRSVFIPYRMGNTFILCHHTHKCKPTQLAGVMANDFAHDWGETTYHYIDGGHIHHNMVTKELNGARFESFNQMAPSDKYAHDAGWRSRSLLTTVLRSKTYGEVGRFTLTAEEVKDRIMSLKPGSTAKKRRAVHTV